MTRRSHKNGLAILAATSAALAMGATPVTAMPPDAPSPVASGVATRPSPVPATFAAHDVAGKGSWDHGPRRHLLAEVGGFGFGIHDGNAGTFGAGIQAAYRFSRWLAMGAWLEGSGQREQSIETQSARYRLYDLGFGPTVWQEAGPIFGDLSVFSELTLLTIEPQSMYRGQFHPGDSLTRWGAAAEARLRLGLVLGPLRPFIFVAGSYALTEERLTLEAFSGESITLSRSNVRLGLGLAYCFGEAR